MPRLEAPTVEVHTSFLEAMAEFRAEGRGGVDDDSMVGRDIRELGTAWHDPAVFSSYVARLNAERLEDTPRPEGWVPCTTWWWLEGTTYLGRIALRHRLTDHLRKVGGHIGYDVRGSARRRGHATAMLRAVLPVAGELGIDRALLTCDNDNLGSVRVIEACGGKLEDRCGDKLRYWVPTSSSVWGSVSTTT